MAQATLVFQVKSVLGLQITSAPPDWSNVKVGTTVTHTLTANKTANWSLVGPADMTIGPGPSTNVQLTWTPSAEVETQVTVVADDGS